jgi:hypothetical protein
MRPLDRIDYLHQLHDEFNKNDFGNKLMKITILIKKNMNKDGWYEYRTEKRNGDSWSPAVRELHRACIVLSEGCWEEDSVEGTLLHEMIHQYQAEVLNRATSHDAIFSSMARKLENKYGYKTIKSR